MVKIQNNSSISTLSPANGTAASPQWSLTLNNNVVNGAADARTKRKKKIQRLRIANEAIVTIDPLTSLTDGTAQFLYILIKLWNDTPGHENSNKIDIDLQQYMKLHGMKETRSNRKYAKKQINKYVANLYGISVKAVVIRNTTGKVWNVETRLFQAKAISKDGTGYSLKMSDDFYHTLIRGGAPYLLYVPTKLLQIPASKEQYTFRIGLYLSKYKKKHLHEKVTTTIVKTLINRIGILKNKDRHLFDDKISPILTALYRLKHDMNLFDYKFIDANGQEVNNFKGKSLKYFESCRLRVKWLNYPEKKLNTAN